MSETGQIELLPCPFCGTAPVLDEHPPEKGELEEDRFFVIRCTDCGISKEWHFKENAARWWNQRAELTRLQQANAALAERMRQIKARATAIPGDDLKELQRQMAHISALAQSAERTCT